MSAPLSEADRILPRVFSAYEVAWDAVAVAKCGELVATSTSPSFPAWAEVLSAARGALLGHRSPSPSTPEVDAFDAAHRVALARGALGPYDMQRGPGDRP